MIKKIKIIYYYFKYKNRKTKDLLSKQMQDFNKLKKDVLSKSNFYKNFYKFEDFPVINKKIMMDNFNDINTKGLKKEECFEVALKAEKDRNFKPRCNKVTIGLSSGTSGNRGLFIADEHEEALWAGNILSKVLDKGLFSEYNIAFFLRANSNLYESINTKNIKLNYYDIKLEFNNLIKNLNLQKPEIIIAPSQVIVKIAEAYKSGRLLINPKKVYYVAEVMSDVDKEYVEKILRLKLDTIYQATEGFLGITCKNKKLHLNEEDLIIEKEWIDNKRFYPIITDLNRRSQPIIRYRLDDILVFDEKGCDCGWKGLVIKKVEGRKDDILIFINNKKEEFIFPDVMRQDFIKECSTVNEYKIEQLSYNKLIVYIDDLTETTNVKEALKNYFSKYTNEEIKINIKEYKSGKIENKLRRIERKFNND